VKNSLAIFVVLLVSVVGVVLLAGSRAATGATLSLASTSTSVAPGSNFSVTIKEDSGSDPINSVQAGLDYDATQLQFVGLTEGTAFPMVAATSTSTPGVILVGRATQTTPVTGSNDVVTANFKVIATSGSINLSFDKNYSFVVRSTDNVDVLSTTTGSTYTVTGTSTSSASMTLSPATANVDSGSTVAVTVRENSGTAVANSVQSSVGYDATKLQYMGLTEGGTFTSVTSTDAGTAGVVKIARAVQSGSNGVAGDNPIVTLNFKVLASTGTTALTIDKTQSSVTEAVTNNDILATVAGNTLTITTVVPSSSTLSLSPTGGTFTKDSTISVNVKASSTENLTTVQSTLNYPAAQLQFVGVTEGGVFTTALRTNTSTAGTVDIIRGLPGGTAGVTGTNPVVTVTFKVLGSSGTAAVTFAGTSALYDDTGTGTNILNLAGSTAASYTLAPSTVTPPPPPPAGTASFSLAPTSGSFTTGSTIPVAVKVSSTNALLTTVETAISYPAAQLQYVSITEGSVFTVAQRTNTATPGVLDIIRGIPGGSAGVGGTNTVVTLNFKVIGTSGTAAVDVGAGSAIYDDSGTGTSILDVSVPAHASYTIAGVPTCTLAPTTPGTPAKTASNYTTISLSWTASTAGAACTMAGYHVYRDGAIVGDVTSGTSFTDSGLTSGTSYSYTVKAFDTSGNVSTSSTASNLTSKTDDMAPTTPVSVTAAAPDAASVNLSWGPSTDFPNPGGVGVQGYRIYRDGATAATYSVNTGGTTFVDSNVSAGTTYSYTVTSFDKLGNESAPSNIVSAKTQPAIPTCSGSPTTPSGLTSGTSTLTATSLSWSASTAASGCTLAGYRVFRDAVLVGTVTATSFDDSGLTPSTSYNYTVQAYDTNGHASALSTAQTIATLADTQAPTVPGNVTAVAPSAGRVTVSWTASSDNIAVTGYKVYRGGSLIATKLATDRSHDDTTVTGNSDYSYTVSAVDAAGNESAKATATPNPVHTPTAVDTQAPTIPSGLQVSLVSTNSTILDWTASTDNVGVSGYHVYRDGTLIGDATSTGYPDSGLTANTTYSYTVKAFDAAGNTSAASAALSVTTTQATVGLIGDLNSDGIVDLFDLSIMMSHWNDQNVPVKFGDINQDGVVDQTDLDILLSHLGDTL